MKDITKDEKPILFFKTQVDTDEQPPTAEYGRVSANFEGQIEQVHEEEKKLQQLQNIEKNLNYYFQNSNPGTTTNKLTLKGGEEEVTGIELGGGMDLDVVSSEKLKSLRGGSKQTSDGARITMQSMNNQARRTEGNKFYGGIERPTLNQQRRVNTSEGMDRADMQQNQYYSVFMASLDKKRPINQVSFTKNSLLDIDLNKRQKVLQVKREESLKERSLACQYQSEKVYGKL